MMTGGGHIRGPAPSETGITSLPAAEDEASYEVIFRLMG